MPDRVLPGGEPADNGFSLKWIVFSRLFRGDRMRRRSFIASLPLAVAGAVSLSNTAEALGQSGASAEPELAKFQLAGAERFNRPDVHTGDRISGASFASRS